MDCWGDNTDGQLGNGSTGGPDSGGYDTAQSVVGITKAVALSDLSFDDHFSYCAVLLSGGVDCWGDNSLGQLGNGTTGGPDGPGGEWGYDTPQMVTGITDAAKVVSNGDAFCALLTSGSLECWGANGAGQLGNGEFSGPDQCVGALACYDTPQTVTAITNATQVVATSDNTVGGFCAVLVTGGVDCWGQNANGQLGIGIVGGPTPKSPTAFDTPQAVSGITNARSMVSGVGSYCVVLATGGVNCWGMDSFGQIGNGDAPPNDGDGLYGFDTPQAVIGISDAVSVVSDGPGYCALLSSAGLECWGDNSYGQLGKGAIGGNGSDGPYSDNTPQPVTGITNATAVFGSTGSYCAILSSGKTKCWGDNIDGQLGNGTTGGPDQDSYYDTPQTVVGIVEAAFGTSLSNWPQSAYCLALSTGGVDCWGDNSHGQLGNGTIGGPTGEDGNNAYNEPQAVLAS